MLITSLFGGAGAGMAGKAMMNRMGDLKEFDFIPLGELRPSMHITIAVTGWITHDQNDYTAAWRVCCCVPGFWVLISELPHQVLAMYAQTLSDGEQYCVRWESEELGKLGDSLYTKLSAGAVGMCVPVV